MAIKRIQKGSPDAFMQAVENKIVELGGDVTSSTKVTASYEDGAERWAQIDLHAEDEYKYSGNLGRSWVRVDSDAIDIWPSKEAAIENGKSSFKRNYKYGRDWDVVNIDDIDDIDDIESTTTTIASTDIKAADEFDDIEYLDALKLAVEGYVEAQGYSCTTDIIDNLYFEVQLFDDDEEDFETPIYVYVIALDDIEPNMDEVDDDAQTIANDAVEEYESSLGEILDEKYTEIRSKSVLDSGGFTTDYTMYRDNRTGTYFFMFGDKDLYDPDPAYADWECETKEEADEWFDSYNGFDEDED